MPDLSHLWQRFLIAIALIFGLLLGVGATVFGYSNTSTVTVGWSVFHLARVPLWAVAIVPLVMVLVAGTLYHWYNSFHHFTQHMRHRHRVRELEAEVESLRAHLDKLLEMPDTSGSRLPAKTMTAEAVAAEPVAAEAPALSEPAPAAANGGDSAPKRSRKRVSPTTDSEPVTVSTEATSGATSEPAAAEPEPAAQS